MFKFNYRVISFIGISGISASIYTLSYMSSLYTYIFFYGVCFGIFIGFGYLSGVRNCYDYLPDRKGNANILYRALQWSLHDGIRLGSCFFHHNPDLPDKSRQHLSACQQKISDRSRTECPASFEDNRYSIPDSGNDWSLLHEAKGR